MARDKERQRTRAKAYREANRERIAARQKAYGKAYRERILAQPFVTAERLREVLDYDAATGVFTTRVQRSNLAAGTVVGCRNRTAGYMNIGIDGRMYGAHRLAWLYQHGVWPSGEVDHINGITDDNRIENLRCVTRNQNMQNQARANVDSATGMLGVVKKRSGRYRAEITVNGKHVSLGRFDTAEEAHAAYVAAKLRHHPGAVRERFANIIPLPPRRSLPRFIKMKVSPIGEVY